MTLGRSALRVASGQVRLARTDVRLRVMRLVALLIVAGSVGAATGYALVSRGARRDLEDWE
jgi:hypothetical protein